MRKIPKSQQHYAARSRFKPRSLVREANELTSRPSDLHLKMDLKLDIEIQDVPKKNFTTCFGVTQSKMVISKFDSMGLSNHWQFLIFIDIVILLLHLYTTTHGSNLKMTLETALAPKMAINWCLWYPKLQTFLHLYRYVQTINNLSFFLTEIVFGI